MAIKAVHGTSPTTYSFTPVRRRPSSFTSGYFQESTGKEWTAVRCHRLLRPLTSRIAILDKDVALFPSAVAGCPKRQHRGKSVGPSQDRHKSELEDSQGSDADWGQQQPRKRVKRTYSSRTGQRKASGHGGLGKPKASSASSSSIDFVAPGSITVSTPVLTRSSEPHVATADGHSGQDFIDLRPKRARPRCAAQDNDAYRQLLHLRRVLPAARYSIYEGIYNGFEALLRATNIATDRLRPRESRSLFSTCLKAVPRYIAKEREMHSIAVEDSGNKSTLEMQDISLEIYDELESLGSSGYGWKHLRTVLRAHGVHIITSAIDRGILDIPLCNALVTLCATTNDLDAGQSILSSVLTLESIPAPKTVFCRISSESTSASMCLLWDFVNRTSQRAYHLRQITTMLVNELIPVTWLATKDFGQIWTMAIQTLSTESDNTDAATYLQTALSTLSSTVLHQTNTIESLTPPEKSLALAVEQTYSSLLTTLTSMAILSQERSFAASSDLLAADDQVCGVISRMLEYCLAENSSTTAERNCLWIASLLLCHCRDMFTSSSTRNRSDDLLMKHNSLSPEVDVDCSVLAELVCSISACCARAGFSRQLDYLQRIHSILEKCMSTASSRQHSVIVQTIIDSAVRLCDEVPSQDYVDYAVHTSTRFEGFNRVPRPDLHCGKSNYVVSTEFRWEEGISEWVTATPALNVQKSKVVVEYHSTDESETETPYRPSLMRRRNALRQTCIDAPSSEHDKVAESEQDSSLMSEDVFAEASFASMSSQDSEPARQDPTANSLCIRSSIGLGQRGAKSLDNVDASDDELSFNLSASHVKGTIAKCKNVSRRSFPRAPTRSKSRRISSDLSAPAPDDSEDELCI
ncbi:hypothetical protein BP6252_07896 [Coleophoma cylindrospora]|uniref:Uncharacterized protein n=1 Tax=Coleophoma cylindrospora TaxID=1849047 RepID=A0A3D8RB99_9HELO|nr:hypothetical protein BP6252_07896 [Coleophoma cylindrospora]